jgi:L-threonate 2-dehydrogenase
MTKKPSAPALPDNTIVGVVGLGDMGAAIATSILRTYPLVACDLRPEAVAKMVALGARSADSLKSVADQCEVVILVVIDDKQVNQVVEELLR